MKDKELKNSFISEEDFNDKNDIETLDRELEFKIAMYRAIKFLKKWALSLVLSLILSVIFYVSLYSLLDTAITKWVLNPIPILIFVHLVVAMMYLFKYRYEEASYSGEEIERNCTVCGNMLEKYYCTECLKFDVRLKDARVLNDLLNLNPKRKPFFSYQIDGNKVVEISFKGCKLTTIPPLIGELKSLECLDLSENKLTEISVSIGNLTSLKSLSLNNNQLTTLPDSIGNLTSLKDLALYSNKLSTLPESIINLKSLTVLNIQDNIFTEFPKILKKVTSLKDLRIDKELQDEWYRIRFIREVFHFHDLGRIKDKRGMYLLFFTLTLFVFTLIILSLFFYFIFSIIIFFNYLFVQLFIGAI
ncbi:MAG: leucine-rich repeat domain-containing protein, partial [Promethearchaeota archaeon]